MNDFKIGGEACSVVSVGLKAIDRAKGLGLRDEAMDTAQAIFHGRKVCMLACTEAGQCLAAGGSEPSDIATRYLVYLNYVLDQGATLGSGCTDVEILDEGVA